jgi:hypothetical protein
VDRGRHRLIVVGTPRRSLQQLDDRSIDAVGWMTDEVIVRLIAARAKEGQR